MQYQEDSNSITHSPYYGCTVRVVSKAAVCYEGVLDGISIDKDRIFLKNVRVKGNINDLFNRDNSTEQLDTLNTVMIDHLTNDMHIYDQVCLNVRDIQELKLIRLPSTFRESKAKLHAIDPCLVDIRLSPSDEHERMPNRSAPISRRSRGESIGSNGDSVLISSSSNESSSSFCSRPPHEFHDEQIKKFSRLSTTNVPSKPVTLLAKKVLPKKIGRNNTRSSFQENGQRNFNSPQTNNSSNTSKKPSDDFRKTSPIRVTITSNLNPNATPFYVQQRPIPTNRNSSLTFYEQNRFQPRLQFVHPQKMPNVINTGNTPIHSQQNHPRPHQRFIPPRQMVNKTNFNNQTPPPPSANNRIYSSSFSDKSILSQQQPKTSSHEQIPGLMQQTSSTIMDQILSTPPIRERLSVPSYNRRHQSLAVLRPTGSLPYQQGNLGDRNQIPTPLSFQEAIASRRGQRTISGTSSGSSLSIDVGPHSIVQFDSTSNALTSADGQYDFEKANEEFRRYLEMEELVIRRTSSLCSIGSHPDDNVNSQQANSYKKEISFFDRISCTATTGTAVGYTEMDEVEKNRETFGDDALLISSGFDDNEWQI